MTVVHAHAMELLPMLEAFWWPSGFEKHLIPVLGIPSHREHGMAPLQKMASTTEAAPAALS